jgi:hypothetical protein
MALAEDAAAVLDQFINDGMSKDGISLLTKEALIERSLKFTS